MDYEQQIGILRNRGALRRGRMHWTRRAGLFADNGTGDGGGGGGGEGGEGNDPGNGGNGEGGEGGGDGIDPAELKTKVEELSSELERYKAKHAEQEKHIKQAQDAAKQRAREAEEAARKAGDTEALEKSWREKLESQESEYRSELEKLRGMVQDLTAGQEAQRIASELAVQGSAKALLPHIRSRLKTEIRDGKPTTVVLDENGKPSAMTPDELRESFRADPAFAPLIVGSKANGSGGPGNKPAGGGKTISASELDKMTPKEKAGFFKENPNVTVTD